MSNKSALSFNVTGKPSNQLPKITLGQIPHWIHPNPYLNAGVTTTYI